MESHREAGHCANCPVNRRSFIKTGCLFGSAGILTNHGFPNARVGNLKARVRIIYSLHDVVQPRPDWPNVGFDFGPEMRRISAELRDRCPKIEFMTSMAKGEEDAKAILETDSKKDVDGYLVYQMNCWNRVVQTIVASGKPVLYADFQYGGSGGFLVYTAGFLRKRTSNLGFVASSRIEDLASAVNCFQLIKDGGSPADFAAATDRVRLTATPQAGNLNCTPDDISVISTAECLKKMRASRILAVRDQTSRSAEDYFGIPMQYISFGEVNDAWKRADKEQSQEIAEKWRSKATAVIDVPEETLLTSAAMYLGMKEVLGKYGANAITINCLGGFYGGHIHAYPCLGFHELNNEGLIGACECDVASTATMVMVTALTQGRPGYISDPVIDTSRRQIIYAHCVAPNKVFGPEGRTNPYSIMTHSEDRQGASLRSLLPLGYMTTSLRVNQERKEILFHQGKTVANDPDDRACRTKIAAEPVGDIEKLFTQWDQWSWHRVTAYGDLKEPVFDLADRIGWRIVKET